VVTSVFPPGGKRGEKVSVELRGPNIPVGTRREVTIAPDERWPVLYLTADGPAAGNHDVPFQVGDQPEGVEVAPNDELAGATRLTLPITMNGQFEKPGDADCYRVTLRTGETLDVETTAHRFLRGPADTRVEILDAAGKLLTENDDGFALDYMWMHDYLSTDSSQRPRRRVHRLVRAGCHGAVRVLPIASRQASSSPHFQLWHPGTVR
jgi:hypothetical protein